MKRLSQAFLLVLATNVAVPMEASFFDFWKAAAPKPVIQVQVPSEISTGKLVLGTAAVVVAAVALGYGCSYGYNWLMNRLPAIHATSVQPSPSAASHEAVDFCDDRVVESWSNDQGKYVCTVVVKYGDDHILASGGTTWSIRKFFNSNLDVAMNEVGDAFPNRHLDRAAIRAQFGM